ncbi:MAG: DUF4349 domain-containing protein [Lachnospiraceae bacterium]|nr:DUF4349 domain-containing protein [Lachnospiraceae bacterium]
MNRDQFEKAMDDLDEKIVAEAAGYKKPALRNKIIKIGSLAACAVLVMVGVVGMISGGKKDNAADYHGESYYSEGKQQEENDRQSLTNISKSNSFTGDDLAPADAEAPDREALSPSYSGQKNGSTSSSTVNDPSKIIYSAQLTLESKEFDKCFEEVEKIVSELGGYFEDQSVYDQGVSVRKASMTIRVPKDQFSGALERLKGVAHVTFSNQSAENVSKDYYDIKSRLDTANIKLERLQGLLKDAVDMTDIIEIENAISEVEWEIDYYSGTLRDYDALIDYSTIKVDLEEVQELTDTSPEPVSFGARLKNAFVYGFENIGDSLVDLVEWVVGNIVWLALIAAAIIIAVKVIKKKRRAL